MDDNALQLYLAILSTVAVILAKLIEAWVNTRRNNRVNRPRKNKTDEPTEDSEE